MIGSILSVLAPPQASVQLSNVKEVLETLQSPSFFGDELIVWIDEVEKLSKGDQKILAQFAEQPLSLGYLILGGRGGKAPFFASVEKQGVVLDLLEEKPWEREKRLSEQIEERVERAGKRLSSDVAPLLFERLGNDPALLDQEVDKLLCYVGERLNIERSDLFRITGNSRQDTLWQTADEIVWEKGGGALSGDLFHSLVPLLRSQLHLGLKLATLIETKVPSDQWGPHLPKLWPKTLEKRSSQAAQKGSGWFRRALDLLFEIELLSRNGSSETRALLDLFRMRIL